MAAGTVDSRPEYDRGAGRFDELRAARGALFKRTQLSGPGQTEPIALHQDIAEYTLSYHGSTQE